MKKNIILFQKLWYFLKMYVILIILFLLSTLLFLHEIIWKIYSALKNKWRNETALKPTLSSTYGSAPHFT